jgi:hypothetical protein
MTKAEAIQIVEQYLETYRQLSYSELVLKIGEQETFEGINETGEKYQVEVDFFFDDEKTKNLRVTAMISYDTATDFSPVVSDFIIAPYGNFIGE